MTSSARIDEAADLLRPPMGAALAFWCRMGHWPAWLTSRTYRGLIGRKLVDSDDPYVWGAPTYKGRLVGRAYRRRHADQIRKLADEIGDDVLRNLADRETHA